MDFRLFPSPAGNSGLLEGERIGMSGAVVTGNSGEGSDGIGLSGASPALAVPGSRGHVPSRSQPGKYQLESFLGVELTYLIGGS